MAMQEDICDICGDIGVPEVLTTCCQCKRNTEHIYCMRIPLEEPVDDWCCEVCKGGELRAETRKLPNGSRSGAGEWETMVPTGKTKYICVKEALRLSTGEKKHFPSSSFTCQPKIPRHKSGMYKVDWSTVRPKTALLDFSSHRNLASDPKPLRSPKPQRPGNMEIREKQLQQQKKQKLTVTEELSPVSSLRPSEALKVTNKVKEQPSEVQLPVKKRLVKQSRVPSVNASTVSISGGDSHNNAIDPSTSYADNMSNNILLDSEEYSQMPALDALWKGRFRIQDDLIQAEKNHLVEAHPSSRVRKKIYEFSKQMPEVLQFELVPSGTFWKKLFDEYIPDIRDIALYFFPGVGVSSEENYILLVESLSSNNLALRIQIENVELLVFSSKLLPVNYQCWEGKDYLWGVFHRLKRDSITQALELSVQPSDDVNHDQSRVNGHKEVKMDKEGDVHPDQSLLKDREEVDMDVDMIGGINIGIMEIPVQREVREPLRLAEPAAATALPRSAPQIASISRSSFAPIATIPSLNVKIESHDVIPPGFEELHRLRAQSSSYPVGNFREQVGKVQTRR